MQTAFRVGRELSVAALPGDAVISTGVSAGSEEPSAWIERSLLSPKEIVIEMTRHTVSQHPTRHVDRTVDLVVLSLLFALLILTIVVGIKWLAEGNVNSEPARNLSAIPQDGRAYFTEPYWNMGEVAAIAASKDLSALPQDGRAYYTEPYWNAGK